MLISQRKPGAAPVEELPAARIKRLLTGNSKLAMPNPNHAPYGKAALETLHALDLTPWITNRLVIGENAAQTLQFVQLGAAQAGLIPGSLASAVDLTRFELLAIDSSLHEEVLHHMILMNNASSISMQLHDWLLSETARTRLIQFGLSAP